MNIDILVNGQRVDILDRNSINLRLNNVLYDPTEINNVQAEYSFSFNLPTTPNNNRIFDYANVLAKLNKFSNTYKCEVYSDEILIFEGNLRIQSIKKGFYNVNLVNIKINTLEDIFGDMRLNEVEWSIPFNGAPSINTYNADGNSKVIFPLISYGVFQKDPISTNYDYNNYTGKTVIDNYTRFYYESFSPSANLIELVKRLFEQRGYNVSGDVFRDERLNYIYMSTNIADDQKPTYNIGNPTLGKASVTAEFSNYYNVNNGQQYNAGYLEHDLSFPYQGHYYRDSGTEYNWPSVDIYDIWASETSRVVPGTNYLFDDNCIVIPADGLYKVSMVANITLPAQTIVAQEYFKQGTNYDPDWHNVTLNNSLKDDMPVEIQLVRNENECELIHGSKQWMFSAGSRTSNVQTWYTAYPHEQLYSSKNPTSADAQYGGSRKENIGDHIIATKSVASSRRPGRPGTQPDTPSTPVDPSTPSTQPTVVERFEGYMPKDGQLLAYDPWVNPNFIAGVSTVGEGTPSFIKNGYSWNQAESTLINSRYNCNGYQSLQSQGRSPVTYSWTNTSFNKNELIDAPGNTITLSDRSFVGSVSGIVELKKDDVLMLKALARHWENNAGSVKYKFDCTVSVTIEAYSPNDINTIESKQRTWNSPSEFDVDLRIGEFLNKETKASDFINNFLKEFNLSFVNEGKNVYINTQRFRLEEPKYCINLDNRVNEAEATPIEYPGYMDIKYKIDTEEWGFEQTVPEDKINLPDWKEYGDYGSSRIEFTGDNTSEEIQLNTSYTYYDWFLVTTEGALRMVEMPVISKAEWMIEGVSYDESMKHDGKGLPLRYWFRGYNTFDYILINKVFDSYIYDVRKEYKGLTLSYKDEPGTILTEYFNVQPDLGTNFISVDCYLTANEYQLIKNGADVIFDSDIYIVSEIQGFDASGLNKTTLKLIKKK